MSATIERQDLEDFTELLEDTIAYFCNEYRVSGEMAWVITKALAQTKLHEMNHEGRL